MVDFLFKNNAVVDNLDNVPDQYRPFYVDGTGEHQGKKVLDPKVKPLADQYDGLYGSFADERGKTKTLNAENAQRRAAINAFAELATALGITPEGETPLHEAFKAHIDGLNEAVKGGKDAKLNLDKINQTWEGKLKTATQAGEAKSAKMLSALERYLVGQAATEALAKANAVNTELLLPHVQARVKVVPEGDNDYVARIVDKDGDIQMNGQGQPMTVADFVAAMKTNPTYALAFKSESGGGSGKKPGTEQPAPKLPADGGELTPNQKIERGLAARQKAAH